MYIYIYIYIYKLLEDLKMLQVIHHDKIIRILKWFLRSIIGLYFFKTK